MQWKRLAREQPINDTVCVVGHYDKNKNKSTMGIWVYHVYGAVQYWQTKSGCKITCSQYDKWCDVEDIINAVGDRLEDELRSTMKGLNLKDRLLN